MKNSLLLLVIFFSFTAFSQDSNSPLVSFEDYENLMKTVKEHRKTRLVDLNTFNAMSLKQDVYILDTRSKEMYDRKHVKGAIHLNFSDFTQENLDALFPHRNVTILIYCNNNFMDHIKLSEIIADENFASKISIPKINFSPLEISTSEDQAIQTTDETANRNYEPEISELESENINPQKAITLALNIPTYINLFGYGYHNIYELSELVSIHDSRIQFEGTEVTPIEK